jgi:DNA-binding beta-propeller fold protein YncE
MNRFAKAAFTGVTGFALFSAALTAFAAEGKLPPATRYTVFAEGLERPRGLLFLPSGDLVVAEEGAGRIAKINRDGRVSRLAGGLRGPHDIEADAKGNLYVAETGRDRVALITPAGQVTTYIGNLGGPVDLAFNPAGELLVCELHKARVVAFRSPKEMRVVLASVLQGPHGLAFDDAGTTYINDWSGNKVIRLGATGGPQTFAQVEDPVGLVRAPSGDLYVAQPQAGMLSRIRPDGTRITLLEGLGSPRDPAFDAAGHLYIAETDTGRILRLADELLR